MGLRGPLPIPAGDLPSSLPAAVAGKENLPSKWEGGIVKKEERSLALAVKNLTGLLACKEVKVVQKAIIARGHSCFGDANPDLLSASLSALFTLSKSKAEDVLFSIGEALSFIWGGVPVSADKILKTNFVSLSASTNFLNEGNPAKDDDDDDVDMGTGEDDSGRDPARDKIIKKLFDELLFGSRTDERCAGCVWLVSIISYSGKHARVQKMLPEIQEALSHLLGDQNELTQEMSSRGMSIVYELGDAATKNELVQALVNNLSGTAKKKRAVKVLLSTV
ncbi:hypothetical protein R1flu_023930 [Riccia fluitans]|uniref:ARM repeat superfamily protein n=1 Tax=Riccia fluitans TaxID=41844 RepID=A0ABD1XXI6_9MARC